MRYYFLLSAMIVHGVLLAFAPSQKTMDNIAHTILPVSISQNNLDSPIWRDFFDKHSHFWNISVDPYTAIPHRIYGCGINMDE